MTPRSENAFNNEVRKTQTEMRWEGRLWTLFQLGMVALVGFLTMQAVETQRILAQITTEVRYANLRLDKIENALEHGTNERYRASDARRDSEIVSKRLDGLENRLNAQAEAIQDLRRRTGNR